MRGLVIGTLLGAAVGVGLMLWGDLDIVLASAVTPVCMAIGASLGAAVDS